MNDLHVAPLGRTGRLGPPSSTAAFAREADLDGSSSNVGFGPNSRQSTAGLP